MSTTVGEMAASLGFEAAGALELTLSGAARPDRAGVSDLALAMDRKFLPDIAKGAARAAMLPPDADWRALGLEAAIFAPRARVALAAATRAFATPPAAAIGVHPTAQVAPDAEIGEGASIGAFAVVESGARIGARTRILSHASIGEGAGIGADGLIYNGARICAGVRVGARAIIHPNAVIGSDGFSFVTPEKGSVEQAKETGAAEVAIGAENTVWARIYSIGSVEIGDDVEIGANTTIDRGTVVSTRIGGGTKIDNLVQIGHNVQIGENCLICGHAGVAGSAEIGDRVVLGGKAGVADHSRIGSDVMVMSNSGVSGVVKSRSVVGGAPAIPRNDFAELVLAMRRLPRLLREFQTVRSDVAAIKKRFSEDDGSG